MAKQTPEGKVKARLLKTLKAFGDDCFYYMPVQNGMGQTGIPDVMAIIHRIPFAFECKATPKQHPTTRQAMALDRIHKAGGIAWVVDNESIDLVIKAFANLDGSGDFDRNTAQLYADDETFATLYRWREKLAVMEFDDATCS